MQDIKISYEDNMFIENIKISKKEKSNIDFNKFRIFVEEINKINDNNKKKIFFYNNEHESEEEITTLKIENNETILESKWLKYYDNKDITKIILSPLDKSLSKSAYLLDKNNNKIYIIGEHYWFAIEEKDSKTYLRVNNSKEIKEIHKCENKIKKTFYPTTIQFEGSNILENIHFTVSGDIRIDFKNSYLNYVVLNKNYEIIKTEKNNVNVSKILKELEKKSTKSEINDFQKEFIYTLNLDFNSFNEKIKETKELLSLAVDFKDSITLLEESDIKKIFKDNTKIILHIKNTEEYLNIFNKFNNIISFSGADRVDFQGEIIKFFLLENSSYDIKDFNIDNFRKLESLIVSKKIEENNNKQKNNKLKG